MYLESWHIKKELIKAIESTNCEEGELLIIKTKLKEFTINCLNFIFGFGVLGVFFGLGGLIFGGDAQAKDFGGRALLATLPASAISYYASERLKKSIIDSVSKFIHIKKIKPDLYKQYSR